MNYLLLFGIGVVGWLLHSLLKAKSIQDKAHIANIEFKFGEYFTKDWISHSISFLGIGAYLLILSEIVNGSSIVNGYVKTLSLFVGYSGADIVSRFFSTVNKKVNAVIDSKTTELDSAKGNLDTPTPKNGN